MMKFAFVIENSPMMNLKPPSGHMTYFQQSVYVIEEFISFRKRMSEFKTDKYYLFKSISKTGMIQTNTEQLFPSLEKLGFEDFMLSSCEHSFKHFMNQLYFMQNNREVTDISRTLIEVMKILNSNRFLYGASNRLYGIQCTRIEPCNVILFTANPKFKEFDRF